MEGSNNSENVSPPNPPQDEILRMDDENANNGTNNESNEDKEQNPMENIIPLEKLKNGWFALSGFVQAQASVAHAKAVEAYNSETAQSVRRKSVEYYEKTCEAAAPVWESAKSTAYTVGEKTKEGVAQLSESLKPTVEVVGEKMNQAMKAGYEASAGAAEYAQQKYHESMGGSSSSSSSSSSAAGSSDHATSAMDSATKGGPTVL